MEVVLIIAFNQMNVKFTRRDIHLSMFIERRIASYNKPILYRKYPHGHWYDVSLVLFFYTSSSAAGRLS